jgi:hypothetical protein
MRPTKSILLPLLVAFAPFGTAASQSPADMPTPADVRALIAQHHANVFSDTAVNAVIIILDINAKYVKGVATRYDSAEVTAADSGWARLGRLIGTREGRLQADTLWTRCLSEAATQPSSDRPVCILDGVRVDAFDQLRQLAIRNLEIVSGAAASARYGAGAANGAVVATTSPTALARLTGLGVTAANIESLQTLRVRPGIVGPNRLDITVLMLKGGKH